MIKLGELLAAAGVEPGESREAVTGLAYDSRKVKPGSVFFAFPGSKADGRAYAQQAVERGAVAVVSESEAPEGFAGRWIRVEHGRRALAAMARVFHGAPDERLRLIGVTGTNGKTTTVYLIDEALRRLGRTTGMLGTVEYRILDESRPAVNTTPESLDLAGMFAELAGGGATECSLEVSSHALELGRVFGFDFHTAVFTNLTQDHLDFHETMENYFAAKQRLFDGAGGRIPKFAVVNGDDEWVRAVRTSKETQRIVYGLGEGVELRGLGLAMGIGGIEFSIDWRGERYKVRSSLAGTMNAYNLLAALGSLVSVGVETGDAVEALAECRGAPGRFERVDAGQPFMVAVDYAHTDDALQNVIRAARQLTLNRVITVFGCGGDRDRKKRPKMGKAAAELSDYVVVTSDNPRSEDPLLIINDILVGVQRTDTPHSVVADRREAIRKALQEARPGDVVILAGKGHETYQIIGESTIAFDDREVARQELAAMGYEPVGGRP